MKWLIKTQKRSKKQQQKINVFLGIYTLKKYWSFFLTCLRIVSGESLCLELDLYSCFESSNATEINGQFISTGKFDVRLKVAETFVLPGSTLISTSVKDIHSINVPVQGGSVRNFSLYYENYSSLTRLARKKINK